MIPPSFTALLSHNNPPDVEHFVQVTRFRDQRKQLISLNEKAQQRGAEQSALTSEEFMQLRTAHTRLRKQELACDVILSPFRNISTDDVLYEIIIRCPNTHPLVRNTNSPAKHIPTILGRTSQRWRRVSHGMPTLWQEMRMDCEELGPRRLRIIRSIEHFSRLAGSLPVGIKLDGGDGVSTPEGYDDLHRILA
ncbi:hypothetical protein BJ165DRAFT_1530540 [Panaeolus papilionaceus]|nr:hypothetical protein BJ165DRAFT_1530540 [Panaeolus papilionaceus]